LNKNEHFSKVSTEDLHSCLECDNFFVNILTFGLKGLMCSLAV